MITCGCPCAQDEQRLWVSGIRSIQFIRDPQEYACSGYIVFDWLITNSLMLWVTHRDYPDRCT